MTDEVRLLPHNDEAEQVILGTIIKNETALEVAMQYLGVRDFYDVRNQKIYRTMCEMSATGKPIDKLTIRMELKARKELQELDERAYVSTLPNEFFTPDPKAIPHYCLGVKKQAELRRLIQKAHETKETCFDRLADPVAIASEWQAFLIERSAATPDQGPGYMTAAEVMKEPSPIEIIEGICWGGHISVVVSESGAGKTFVLLSMSASITSNVDWLGRQVERGSVVYVTYEGDDLRVRLSAINERQGHRLDNFYRIKANEPLSPTIDRDRCEVPSPGEMILRAQLRALQNNLQANERPPIRLLVIDTVRASLSGSEDSSEAISAYLRAVRRVSSDLPDTAIILAHHAGWQDDEKGKKKRERGSSAFRGNSDCVFYLEAKDEDEVGGEVTLSLSTLKTRDSEKPKPLYFIRRSVSINEAKRNGQPKTSCVIEPDRSTPEDREAKVEAAIEAENRPIDLKVLRAIFENPRLTSERKIALTVKIARDEVARSLDRLLQMGRITEPEKQRQPYSVTERGINALQGAQNESRPE